MNDPQSNLALGLIMGLFVGLMAGGLGVMIKAVLAWKRVPAAAALTAGILAGGLLGIGGIQAANKHTATMLISAGVMGALVPLASTARFLRSDESED